MRDYGAAGQIDFYPRPPRGGRRKPGQRKKTREVFLSTPSARRATTSRTVLSRRSWNFYPRPPRGGRLLWPEMLQRREVISIHALREEGDGITDQTYDYVEQFLSTPSARRATRTAKMLATASRFLSTPSARRATRLVRYCCAVLKISIHALREEGDRTPCANRTRPTNFYPCPPRGGRRRCA